MTLLAEPKPSPQGRVATVVLAVVVAAGCAKKEPPQTEAPAIAVTAVTVEPVSASASTERYPVAFIRDREANLGLRVPGVVRTIPVRIGQRFAAGAVLATLDATPYIAARVRAEQELARLERSAERNRSLVPAGALAPSASEDTEGAVATARAALASARYDEASSVARAPFRGVVLSRDAEVGETVAIGQRLLRLADISSPLLARAAVPRRVAAALHPGATARIALGNDRADIAATVRRVGAVADARAGTVDVELVAEGVDFPSGTVASVTFEAPVAVGESSQRLPAEALLDVVDRHGHVFLVDPSTSLARRVELRVDGFDGEQLLVAGLAPGSRVITYGAGFVHDGQKVSVVAR